jgi:hypothetical protein
MTDKMTAAHLEAVRNARDRLTWICKRKEEKLLAEVAAHLAAQIEGADDE